LINNFSSIKSIGNCEITDTGDVLDNLKQFLTVNENTNPSTYFNDTNEFKFPLFQNIPNSITQVGDMTIGYVTGYLGRSIMKVVKHCRICKDKLISNDRTNPLIACRAYTVKKSDPTEEFINAVKNMLNIFTNIIPKICFQKLVG